MGEKGKAGRKGAAKKASKRKPAHTDEFTDKQRINSESPGPKTKRGKARALANLKPFEPGQSGNPAGRPKSITFSEACRKLLAEIEDEATQETVAEALAKAAIREAKAGSAQHLKEINDRVEGKARQPIDLTVEKPREALAAMLGVSPDELPEPKRNAE
jgi:hypothetical protein